MSGEREGVDEGALRALADAARLQRKFSSCCVNVGRCDCQPIVRMTADELDALLDRLAAAEGAVARVRAMLAAWDAWDGSRGPDGRMHPDSSSPRDRERLRAALDGAPAAGEGGGS